jgi:hypothetical protein
MLRFKIFTAGNIKLWSSPRWCRVVWWADTNTYTDTAAIIFRALKESNFLYSRRFVTLENMKFSNWKQLYLLHLSFAVFRTNTMCWVDGSRGHKPQTPWNLRTALSALRKGGGGWAVSPATSKNWPQICFWCLLLLFSTSTKNTSSWRSFGDEGPERPQLRQLSRMLIVRPLQIMKTVLVPGSNSTRIPYFLSMTMPCRLANSYRRFKAACRLHLQDAVVQEDFP